MADLTNKGLDIFHGTKPLRLGVDATKCTDVDTDANGNLKLSKRLEVPALHMGGLEAFTPTKFGAFGVVPVARPATLTQNYATADRTLAAYTPDAEGTAYVGATDGEAKLADLNALRVAYENLRAFTEDLAQFVNALVDDLQAMGLEQ